MKKTRIEFAVSRETDVTVYIENAEGVIVRHLVAGVGRRHRSGASSRSALTAPPPMLAPKRLASRSATFSCGV